MEKYLSFYDPIGNTRLSGWKTLLFCAHHGFSIPHDIAGAIIYSEVKARATSVDYDPVLDIYTPSLRNMIDTRLLFPALIGMGYQDLVEEFLQLDKGMQEFIEKRFSEERYSIPVVLDELEKILPKYEIPSSLQTETPLITAVTYCNPDIIIVQMPHSEDGMFLAGIINLQGDIILPPIYKSIGRCGRHYYAVETTEGEHKVWDMSEHSFMYEGIGNNIVDAIFANDPEPLFVIEDSHRRKGIVSNWGELLIKPQYKYIEEYGPYILASSGEWPNYEVILDRTGKDVLPAAYERVICEENIYPWRYYGVSLEYRYFPVMNDGEWFFVDQDNCPLSENLYYGLGPFTKAGYAIFMDAAGRFGVLDREERVVLDAKYESLCWQGLYCLEALLEGEGQSVQLISPRGENLLPKGWAFQQHKGNYVSVKRKGERAVFTYNKESGRYDILAFTIKHSIMLVNGYVIMFDDEGKRYLLRYDGTFVLRKGYDDIVLLDDDSSRFIVKVDYCWFLISDKEEIIQKIVMPLQCLPL